MATLIQENGNESEVSPDKGKRYSLELLQKLVGGYIQLLNLPDGRGLIFDEEGKLKAKSYNLKATVYAQQCGIASNDIVVGDAVLLSAEEMRRF